MPRVFVSYRRSDLVACALLRSIDDRLVQQFGRSNVFVDIDSIPLGVDFRHFIETQLSRCNVVVALVGGDWLNLLNARRSDPTDFVRIELETAFARGNPVIPLLIGGAAMPGEGDLPESIRPLAYRNAMIVDHGRDFHVHMDRLIGELEFLDEFDPHDSRRESQFTRQDHVALPDKHYVDLENELALGHWKSADLMTGRMMLRLTGRQDHGWLDIASVRSCPTPAFNRIDQLWVTYSRGRFGYSVQNRLYKAVGGKKSFSKEVWERFGEKLGWYKDGEWILYNDMNFSLDAPKGHLPDGFVAVRTEDGSVVRCWVLAMA